MKILLGALIIIFQNTCPDIDVNKPDWTCVNYTQAAQSQETIRQIRLAKKHTGFKKPITIISIDPIRKGKGINKIWKYGAWQRGNKIYFAAMPGCRNARIELERIFRRLA